MKSKKKSIFKKVFASMAVASILISGSVLSGYAAYVQVGNTINGFSLSMKDGTSFGLGNVPAGTQIDQTESYVTIFNDYDYTEGYAYARSTATQSSIGWGQYYIAKNSPSPYVYRYVGVPAGTCTHYWSNTGGGGFRTNLTVYRYTNS